jgi:hypothetical protein
MPFAATRENLFRGVGSSLSRALKVPRYATAWTYSFLRTHPPLWDLFNRAGRILYEEYPPRLDHLQQQVVDGLVKNGIAVMHLDELLPHASLFSEMSNLAEQRIQAAAVAPKKAFLRYVWGDLDTASIIDLDNPFIRFSLQLRILDIVNSYIAVCTKLIYFELGITDVMQAGAVPLGSQRWHRDPGMHRLVKVFLYLTDVDENSGPFTYVRQSHAGGQWGKLFPQKQFGRGGIYPPEGAVDKVVPKSDLQVCTGRAGTIIFCDTTGLHKGGYSLSRPRIMHTSVYVAAGDVIKPKFQHPADFSVRLLALHPVSRFAAT